MKRSANLQIVSRDDFNPSVTVGINFETLDQFIERANTAIDETGFRKVDCIVFDNGQFSDEELEKLDEELFLIE